ncbi:MAG: hypothetical protein ACYDDF_14250 [Thermoplasmatota archaeon]
MTSSQRPVPVAWGWRAGAAAVAALLILFFAALFMRTSDGRSLETVNLFLGVGAALGFVGSRFGSTAASA